MISYEKLLEKVLRAAEMLPDEDRRAFHYFSNTNEIHGDSVMTSQALAEIANDLRAAIAEQTEKAAGRGSAQKSNAPHPQAIAPRKCALCVAACCPSAKNRRPLPDMLTKTSLPVGNIRSYAQKNGFSGRRFFELCANRATFCPMLV